MIITIMIIIIMNKMKTMIIGRATILRYFKIVIIAIDVLIASE